MYLQGETRRLNAQAMASMDTRTYVHTAKRATCARTDVGKEEGNEMRRRIIHRRRMHLKEAHTSATVRGKTGTRHDSECLESPPYHRLLRKGEVGAGGYQRTDVCVHWDI
jgi:hypothetical protein